MAPAQYPAMPRKGTRWCDGSAILCREERASWWCADDWREKKSAYIESGNPVGGAWATAPPGGPTSSSRRPTAVPGPGPTPHGRQPY